MVLITGGTGFLGSYIIKELIEKHYMVRAIRRSTSRFPFYIPPRIVEKVEWVEGDILDTMSLEDAMHGVDTVIHCAAIVSFYKRDKERMYQVNTLGTANVVNTAIEKNISRFVHVSSVAALGRSKMNSHVNEEKKWQENKNNTHYAISKHRAEMEVWRGVAEGLNAVIINPSTILGYGDWNATSCRIFKTIYNGFPWYSTGINGFVDIEDVARTAVLLMEKNIAEQRFIVNADNWSFQQLFNAIADGFGKKRPTRKVTPFLINAVRIIEEMKSLFAGTRPLVTKESARVANSNTFFENDKLLRALPGFSFTPLQESIQRACKKYIENLHG